jgi:hypothetical protein
VPEKEKTAEEELSKGIAEAVAVSLDRMSAHEIESLAFIESDMPAHCAALRTFEIRFNSILPKHSVWDWTLTNGTTQVLLISRSRKHARGKQITKICEQGVRHKEKSFLSGLFGDDEDDYSRTDK